MAQIDSKENQAFYPQHSGAENAINLLKNRDFKVRNLVITLAGCLALSVAVVGQDIPTYVSPPAPQLPRVSSVLPKAQFTPAYQGQTGNPQQAGESRPVGLRVASSQPAATTATVRRITLDEAQQMAGGASNPLVRLGELQVEAAKQHRLGVESMYFPNLGCQFENLHFNKQPGSYSHSKVLVGAWVLRCP